MALVINIRGTNGSGKTTLARRYLPPNLGGDERGGPVDLVHYAAPTKRDPQRRASVEGYGRTDLRTILVGSYKTACGGLDTIASFDRQHAAIRAAIRILERFPHDVQRQASGDNTVIAEGILASTVFGSWGEFASDLKEVGHQFAFTYLQTPLDVCLERIRARQEAAGKVRDIKVELVESKVRAIAATRAKALHEGHLVYDLPFGGETEALAAIVARDGEAFRAKS
jgi:predicted ABC-type ATPase